MPFIENPNTSQYIIHSYAPGEIRVNDTTYRHSIIVAPQQLITDWPPQYINDITAEHLHSIVTLNPEVVLVGTGPEQRFLDPSLFVEFMTKHIGFEMMNTGAACRTFDLLAAEGRRVVAALLL